MPSVKHLTTAELADRLQMDETTLANWRKKRRGPAYIRTESAGRSATIRYPLAEVEAWERRQLVTPVPA